jgi:hypothetical protein
MSQHGSFTRSFVAIAVKSNWDSEVTSKNYAELLDSLEYDRKFQNPQHIYDNAHYMLTQTDGIYGVSHKQLGDWLMREIAGLVVDQVLFENS